MDILTSDLGPVALGGCLATLLLPGLTYTFLSIAIWGYTAMYLVSQYHDKTYSRVGRVPANSNNYALVTGASYGLGLDMAKELARRGYPLVLVARSEDKLEENAKELKATYNVDVRVVTADLTEPDMSVHKIAQFLDEEGINVSILVNDAGQGYTKLFQHTEPSKIRDMINLNIMSLTMLSRALIPAMVRQGYGRILNVSSVASHSPGPLEIVYHATKSYVSSFSLGLRFELQGTGVNVTTLEPGPTMTHFFENAQSTKSRGIQYHSDLAQLQMPSPSVARAGIEGMLEGKRRIVTGRMYKVLHYLSGIMPTQLQMLMMKYQWQQPSTATGA